MKQKNIIIISIYSVLSIVCILAAVFYKSQFSVSILGFPYELLSRLIKAIDANGKNIALGWIFYFIFALAPFVYLVISLVKNKKLYIYHLFYILFVIFHAFALYVFINPTLFINTSFGDLGIEVVKDNVAFMSYLSLFLWLLIYIYKNLKEKSETSFVYAKRTLFVMIGFLLFNIFYVTLFNTITDIKSIAEASSTKALRISYTITLSTLNIIPMVINIIICFNLICFFNCSKDNLFDESNQEKVNKISKWIFIYVIVAIICLILKNMVSLIFNKQLLTLKAELSLDLTTILSLFFFGCLFIFLKKSYQIKEENDLTI